MPHGPEGLEVAGKQNNHIAGGSYENQKARSERKPFTFQGQKVRHTAVYPKELVERIISLRVSGASMRTIGRAVSKNSGSIKYVLDRYGLGGEISKTEKKEPYSAKKAKKEAERVRKALGLFTWWMDDIKVKNLPAQTCSCGKKYIKTREDQDACHFCKGWADMRNYRPKW